MDAIQSPKFVSELPPSRARESGGVTGTGTSAGTIRMIVALAQRPGQWAEIARSSTTTAGGHPSSTIAQLARRWREYGLDVETRREGDEYVAYARIPAVSA